MKIIPFYFDNYPGSTLEHCKSRHFDSATTVWHVAAGSLSEALRAVKMNTWFVGRGVGIIEQWQPLERCWRRYDGSTDIVAASQPGQIVQLVDWD